MNKTIGILGFLLAVCLCSCKDDMVAGNNADNRNPDNGLPIAFITELTARSSIGDAASRATVTDNYKQEFEAGDRIHISAVFTLLDEDGQESENTTTVYDCLSFDGEAWQSTATQSPMTWPWNASKATFTAYYIYTSDTSGGWLTEGSPLTIRLDALTDETDPLMAVVEDVEYGYAVPLTFQHLCTKLSITDVSNNATEFWAKTAGGINDAFSLTLQSDNTLAFAFGKEDATVTDTRVAAQRTEENTVSYYLAPTVTDQISYEGMQLTYRYSRPYLTLNLEELADLEAGNSYVVSITENAGSITIDEDEDDWWDDPDDEDTEEVKVDIDEFLQAICEGTVYQTKDGTPVLGVSSDIQGGTELLVNVDFDNQTPTQEHDLPNAAVFNGNYHYIKNVAQPLFGTINGSISNLNLASVSIEDQLQSATGSMGRTCSANSSISNVRLTGITIQVAPNENANALCDVGALVGNCAGAIETVRLAGNIEIIVQPEDEDDATPLGRIYIGGIVGQLSGTLSDVSRVEEETPGTFTVTNACSNQIGERYTGGLVGLSTGRIANCTMEANVDASEARGVLVYTGGMAGMARNASSASESNGGIFNSTFNGTIQCGRAYSAEEEAVEGHAYAGGLVGYAYHVGQITGNEVFGTLIGPIGDEGQGFLPYTNTIYATGGLFGQAYQSPSSDNTTWIAFKDQLTNDTPNYHIGTIAGRADSESTSTSNTSHIPGNWQEVGATITSEDIPGE